MNVFKFIKKLGDRHKGINKLKLVIIYPLLMMCLIGYIIKYLFKCKGLNNE